MAKVPAKPKQLQRGNFESFRETTTQDTVSTSQPASPKKHKPQGEERVESACSNYMAAHEFTKQAVTLSRLSYLRNQREGGNQPAVCDSPAGQDSSVSSSNTFTLQQVAQI